MGEGRALIQFLRRPRTKPPASGARARAVLTTPRAALGPALRAAVGLSLLFPGFGCAADQAPSAGPLPAVQAVDLPTGGANAACLGPYPPTLQLAALRNGASLYAMPFDLFGRPETGWAVYAPTIESQIGAPCAPNTPGFAQALSRWSRSRQLADDGVLTPDLLAALKADWQSDRPFYELRELGFCPNPPSDWELAVVPPDLSDTDHPIELRQGALLAWTRLVRDAHAAEPALAANPELLRIFSAFRSPAYDEARCAHDSNCQGLVRAACSVHRTGLAVDVILDVAPGFAVDSSADANRLAMTRGLAYRWLVANARRYGFVNYAFEPWHWEWTGASP